MRDTAAAPSASAVADAVMAETELGLRRPLDARRVGGGYSWRTFVLADATGRRVVVRVAPPGGTMSPYDPAVEARAIRAADGAVPAPDVLAVINHSSRLGTGYGVHGFGQGTVPRLSRVPTSEREAYRAAVATTLGHLHARGQPDWLDPIAAGGTTTKALQRAVDEAVQDFARGAACRHPGFTVGIRWLLTHLPEVPDRPVLCHGDFRLHNLAFEEGGVSCVFDWERAWVGDPMVDVAFTRRFSGWCAVDGEAVATYEAASGIPVDEDRVAYGDRFEWVRSYTSAARGWRALAEGRDDALDLYAIGEAGRAGAWRLLDLLDEGSLVAAPDDGLDTIPHAAVGPERRAEVEQLAREAGQVELADHLAAEDAEDVVATRASVDALRGLDPPEEVADLLRRALDHADDDVAWDCAHAALAEAATTGGAELLPALRALGRRHTDRRTLLPSATTQRRTR